MIELFLGARVEYFPATRCLGVLLKFHAVRVISSLKLRLPTAIIGRISYPGECDLLVHPQKYVIFS